MSSNAPKVDWSARWRALQELLGHEFSREGREAMLAACLHGSASQSVPGASDLKPRRLRMAWIGDRIVREVLAELLYQRLPQADPGLLNNNIDHLKSRPGLARTARETGLASYIIASDAGREQAQQDNPLGEFLEAIVGAVYEDGGIEEARSTARKLLDARVTAHLDPEQQQREWDALVAEIESLGAG